jgi:RNA polymerase sigma factor (sigma-70 family)
MVDDPVLRDTHDNRGSGTQVVLFPRDPEADLVAALVADATAGSQQAWDGLVARYNRLVWAVARSFGLDEPAAAMVVQTTWLRLVDHLGTVQHPERVGAWLGATARRESVRAVRSRGRDVERAAAADPMAAADVRAGTDGSWLAREHDLELYRAVLQLSDRCQRLLRMLSASPPPRYETVSASLGLPVGSIGPTRGRCLDKLRRVLTEQGWFGPDAAAGAEMPRP